MSVGSDSGDRPPPVNVLRATSGGGAVLPPSATQLQSGGAYYSSSSMATNLQHGPSISSSSRQQQHLLPEGSPVSSVTSLRVGEIVNNSGDYHRALGTVGAGGGGANTTVLSEDESVFSAPRLG